MNEPEHLACPNCSATISKTDKFCRNCGKDLTKPSGLARNVPATSTGPASEEMYERKYSMVQRFYKLVVSPSEAMKDIGLAPDYGGPLVLVTLRIIIAAVAIAVAFQKIVWTGDSNLTSQVQGILSGVIAFAVLIGVLLFITFWLVKSFLVNLLCDNGSGWSFATAASVTGYAYIADLVFGVIGLIVIYSLIPPITFNVSDLEATRRALADYQAQVLGIKLLFSIPISFVGLLWKSYLGGLGTKFGTNEKSSVISGFVVFLGLALLGWLISFLVRGTI